MKVHAMRTAKSEIFSPSLMDTTLSFWWRARSSNYWTSRHKMSEERLSMYSPSRWYNIWTVKGCSINLIVEVRDVQLCWNLVIRMCTKWPIQITTVCLKSLLCYKSNLNHCIPCDILVISTDNQQNAHNFTFTGRFRASWISSLFLIMVESSFLSNASKSM